ncbi:MAG TPA: response regulator [Kofleriaceae bacterium]|jgi:DNA-binding response OmpR family regulator
MLFNRFLICEPDEQVRQRIQEVVSLAGHEVVSAPDARAALDLLTQGNYVCAFVDIDRLDGNAFEIPQVLRGAAMKGRPRLIAMTARGSQRDFQLAKDSGFDITLRKPLEATALAVALAQLRLQPWLRRPPWKTYKTKVPEN